RVKLAAFTISGAITAIIGAVWFYYLNQVHPQTGFNPLFDLTLVLMVFLSGSISEVIIGAILLLVVLFMPRGIVPTGGEFITKIRTRGRPAVIPATTIGPASSASSASSVSSGDAR